MTTKAAYGARQARPVYPPAARRLGRAEGRTRPEAGMGSMLDLPDALRAAGLRVFVTPDWKTNGHGITLLDHPYGGVLHHTAGFGLHSVYGLPDARPDVPQPRANLW